MDGLVFISSNPGNPTVVTRLDVAGYGCRVDELVWVRPTSVLLEDGAEESVDIKVEPPEWPEVDVLSRIHHRGSGRGSNLHVGAAVPRFNGI